MRDINEEASGAGRLLFFALAAAMFFTTIRMAVLFLSYLHDFPFGGPDALNLWTYRGAFFATAGSRWAQVFEPVYITNSFSYPLMTSNLIARSYQYANGVSVHAPAAIAFMYTFGTLALVAGGVRRFAERETALTAGLALAGTPFIFLIGSVQAADIPFAFYMLLSFVIYEEHIQRGRDAGSAVLTGLALGFCLWTKNEGLMFSALFLFIHSAASIAFAGFRRTARSMLFIAAGLLPYAAAVAHLNLSFGLSNPVLGGDGGIVLSRLIDPSRLGIVLHQFLELVSNIKQFNWFLAGMIVFAPFMLVKGLRTPGARIAAAGILVAAGLLLSCVAANLIYPSADFPGLVRNTLSRFVIQVYPSLIFLCALIASPEYGRRIPEGYASKA